RGQVAGLEPKPGHGLADAPAHFGAGDAPDRLAALLDALRPNLDLPRAVQVRGRYAREVARMEAVGIPFDTDLLARLKANWARIRAELIARGHQRYEAFPGGAFCPRRWRRWLNKNRIRWPRRKKTDDLDLRLETFRDMAEAYPTVRPMKELRATLAQLGELRLAVGADGRHRCPLGPN